MFALIGLICTLVAVSAEHLEVLHQWTSLKYNIPPNYPLNETFRTDLTAIVGVEVGFDRIFFVVTKLFSNSPATLVYVPKHAGVTNPPLEAYPNWDWHAVGMAGVAPGKTCYGFQAVSKIKVDRCGRLWALDSGYAGPRGRNRRIICPPKLVAFDLHSHQPVRRIEFSADVFEASSFFVNLVIDDTDESGYQPEGKCDVGHIYVSDMGSPGVVVINVQTEEMWRHTDPAMWPDPHHARITVAGESFIQRFGINAAALSSPGPGKHRDFFFGPLTSRTIYSVNTAALKSRPNPVPELQELPVQRVFQKSSQSSKLHFDPVEDALLFCPLNESSLVSYRLSDKKFRVLSQDAGALQYVTEIQSAILDNSDIYIVSSRLQKIFFDTVNPHEINQRILRLRRYAPEESAYVNQLQHGSIPQNSEIAYVEAPLPESINSLPQLPHIGIREPSVSYKADPAHFIRQEIPLTPNSLPYQSRSYSGRSWRPV